MPKLTQFFDRVFISVLQNPKRVLFGAFLALIFCGLSLSQIKTELSVYHLVDKNFPSTSILREMKKSFGDDNGIFLIFTPKTKPFSMKDGCEINRWLLTQAQENAEVTSILSPFDLRHAQSGQGRLSYPNIIPLDCRPEAEREVLDLNALKETPWAKIATDRQTRDLAVEVSFRDTASSTSFGKFDPTPIGLMMKNLNETLLARNNNLGVYLGGRSAFQWHFKEMVRKDAWVNLLLLFLIALFFRVFYGTWKSGGILIGLISLATVTTYGAMALVGHPIDVLSNGLFFMICVASLEDFLFVAQEDLVRPQGLRENFRRFVTPSFFTSLTTIIGFGSLYLADLKIIQRFGLWAAVAALLEWVCMFFILPSLLELCGVKSFTSVKSAWQPKAVDWIAALKVRRGVVRVCLLLFTLSFVGFFYLNIDDSPRDNFPKSHPNSLALHYLKESRGWEGSIVVLFAQNDEEKNTLLLEKIAHTTNVAVVDDPYQVNHYFTKGQDAVTSRLILQELNLAGLNKSYFSGDGQMRATLYLKNFDLAHINQTISEVKAICPAEVCQAAGEGVVYADYSNKVSETLFHSFMVSLILVAILLLALSRRYSWRLQGIILLSAFWGPLVMIGLIALFHIPLNLVTSIFASILVGLTGDNAVQYLFASRDGDLRIGMKKRGHTSIHLALLMCLSSLMFLGLTLVPMKLLGTLLFFGFIACLFGDLILLKSLTLRQYAEEVRPPLHPTLDLLS